MDKSDLIIELLERHHLELQKVADAVKVMKMEISRMQDTLSKIEADKITQAVDNVSRSVNSLEYEMRGLAGEMEYLRYSIK